MGNKFYIAAVKMRAFDRPMTAYLPFSKLSSNYMVRQRVKRHICDTAVIKEITWCEASKMNTTIY